MSEVKKKDIQLCEAHLCTGCMACVGSCNKSAISLHKNEEGFSYPTINYDLCVECQLCVKNCAVLNPVKKNKEGTVYAAWSLENAIRQRSSSGGMFSEFANHILNHGGVVVGAALNSEGYVFHKVVDNKESLDELRGSKYVQSIILPEVFHQMREVLKQKRYLLFVGTPCQVAGIRKLFRDNDYLYTIDFVCHGVPSPDYFANYYKQIKSKYPKLSRYNFRMLDSWGAFGNVDVLKNNRIVNRTIYGNLSFYHDAFEKGYLNRPNCYDCQYACKERVGDITLGDFWGIGKYISVRDYEMGCSLLIVNSEKGKELLGQIMNRLYIVERDVQEAIDGGNVNLVHSHNRPQGRNTFYKDASLLSYSKLIKKYNLEIKKRPPFFKQIMNAIKNRIRL